MPSQFPPPENETVEGDHRRRLRRDHDPRRPPHVGQGPRQRGDLQGLMDVLAPDVVLMTDGVGTMLVEDGVVTQLFLVRNPDRSRWAKPGRASTSRSRALRGA
jgi:hypothetical protein